LTLPREQWRSQSTFVLASIGAAVGLGNIWRFSYIAGENGGATFLVVYAVSILLVGLPLVLAESAIGRAGQADAVQSYRKLTPSRVWIGAGALGVLGAFLIMCFYLVIAGWALKYFAGAVTGSLWHHAGSEYGGYFESFISNPYEPVFWQFLMAMLATAVVARGIRQGIERLTRFLMPLLAIIVIGLAVHGVTQKGSAAGLAFLFQPDWSLLKGTNIYLAALGQAFFSLSLGMGLYVTYSSYLAREHKLLPASCAIVAGDSLMAIVAGLAIFPAVFAFGLDPSGGPSLAFISLPQIFLHMPGGIIVGALFFLLLSSAALSASISGIEIVTSYLKRRLNWSRRRAAVVVGTAIFIGGVPASLGFGEWSEIQWRGRNILENMDYIVSNIILPLGGVLTSLFVGWRLSPLALEEVGLKGSILGAAWVWLLRVIIPGIIFFIFLRAIIN